jgi:hypothetical protein
VSIETFSFMLLKSRYQWASKHFRSCYSKVGISKHRNIFDHVTQKSVSVSIETFSIMLLKSRYQWASKHFRSCYSKVGISEHRNIFDHVTQKSVDLKSVV